MDNENPVQGIQKTLGAYNPEEDQKVKKGLLIFHMTTSDPSGAAYNMVQATNRHTRHRARLFTMMKNPFDHPTDIFEITDYGDEIEALLQSADVFHFHKIQDDLKIELKCKRPREWSVSDFLTVSGKKKKVVFHVHGHPYERAHHKELGIEYGKKGNPVLASTPDLEQMYRPYCDARYFPNCVPVWDNLYLPRATNKILEDHAGTKRMIVAHAASDPNLKDVEMIEQAVKYVGKTQSVNLMSIQATPFRLSMIQRRAAHVVFDHMHGYYGLGSLEGLSLGKPVIAGLNDVTIRAIIDFFKIPDVLPWQRPRDQRGLNDAVMDLIANPEHRNHIGKLSRAFVENIWSDKAVAQRLAQFYESL